MLSIYQIDEFLSEVKQEDFLHQSTYENIVHFVKKVNQYYPNSWHFSAYYKQTISEYSNSYGLNNFLSGTYLGRIIYRVHIYIKFGELGVTNSHNMSTIIRDLVIRLEFLTDSEEPKLYGVCGSRFTMTGEEYVTKYTFSHLSGESWGASGFSGFCYGGTKEAMGMLRGILENEYDEDIAEQFLLQLEPYLSWESIEGGPYKPMKTLIDYDPNLANSPGTTINSVMNTSFRLSDLRTVYEILIDRLTDRAGNIKTQLDALYVSGVKFTEDSIEKLIIEVCVSDILFKDKYAYWEDSVGNLFLTVESEIRTHPLPVGRVELINSSASALMFRGEELKLRITNPVLFKGQDEITYKKRIYPKIINYVKTRLENLYKKETNKNYIIKRESFGRNPFGIYAKG